MALLKSLLDLKVGQKGLLLVAMPLAFQLVFILTLGLLLHQTEKEVEKEALARKVNSATGMLARHILDFVVGSVGYGYTRTDTFNDHYLSAVKELPVEADKLVELLKDHPEKRAKALLVKETFSDAMKRADDIRIKIENNEMDRVMARLPALQEVAQEASSILHDLARDERYAEEESVENQARLRQTVKLCLLVGFIINVGVSLALLRYFSASITGRVGMMRENSVRLTSGLELLPEKEGDDELAELDRAFRSMAASIEALTRKERALVECARDVICSISADGKFVSVNTACLDLWGYESDELLGTRVGKMMPAEDHDRFLGFLEDEKQGISSSVSLEARLRRKDGSMADALWTAHWSDEERSYICVCHDVTAMKRSEVLVRIAEARFRSIIENLPVGLVICNASGIIEQSNPALHEMFEFPGSPSGKPLSSLFSAQGESKAMDGNVVLEFNPSELPGNRIACNAYRHDGSRFPIELTCHRIETDEAERYMALIVDVTEKEEIERLKQEFIMILSHELRTPLTSLQMLLELLVEGTYGDLTEKGVSKVGVARRNITRLVKLIQELLDFETIESDKMQMELRECDLEDTLSRAVEASRGPASIKRIELVTDLAALTVRADADRLIQVVINLIGNAVKYSPEGSEINIASHRKADFARVSVIDHGPGIKEEHRQMIFERFKQVDPSASRGKGNVGLGLAISKSIIDRHGGIIGVDSEVGSGSTFWFEIPLV